MPSAHVILEQMDRPIGLILQAPATAAAARIVLCLPFWWSGLSKLLDFSGSTAEMAAFGYSRRGYSMRARSSSSSADGCL